MNSILKDFNNIGSESSLIVLPISRLEISKKIRLGRFILYPKANADIDELLSNVYAPDLEENKNLFKSTTLIAFEKRIHSNRPFSVISSKDSLITTLSSAIEEAEKVIDIIRFYYCNYNNPYSLPSKASQLDDGRSAILIYSNQIKMGGIEVGQFLPYKNTLGDGLFLDDTKLITECNLFKSSIGEVGHIAEHALSLNTSILEAHNQTSKFTNAMTLLEYLAYPDYYKKFEDVKKEISIHVANNKSEYHNLLARFYELTSKEGHAYRTKIIHLGQRIETILNNDALQIEILLDEIQSYCCCVIDDLIKRCEREWKHLKEWRKSKHEGILKDNNAAKIKDKWSRTAIFIDGNFLKNKIKENREFFKRNNEIYFGYFVYKLAVNLKIKEADRIVPIFIVYDIESKNITGLNPNYLPDLDSKSVKFPELGDFDIHALEVPNPQNIAPGIETCINPLIKNCNRFFEGGDFRNIIVCADREEYSGFINNLLLRNVNVKLIRSHNYETNMPVEIQYFNIDYLVGLSLGLSVEEL